MPLDSVINPVKCTTFYLRQRSTELDVGSSEQGQNMHHDGNKEPLTIQTDVTVVSEVGSAGPITGVGNSPEVDRGEGREETSKNVEDEWAITSSTCVPMPIKWSEMPIVGQPWGSTNCTNFSESELARSTFAIEMARLILCVYVCMWMCTCLGV